MKTGIRTFCIGIGVGCLLGVSFTADAVTLVNARLIDAPNYADGSAAGFQNVILDAAGVSTTFQIGWTRGSGSGPQASFSRVSAVGTELRPALPTVVPLDFAYGLASSDFPQPRLLMAGIRTENSISNRRVVAYCGADMTLCLDREVQMVNAPQDIALVTQGSGSVFDFIVSSANELSYQHANSPSPVWTKTIPDLRAMALVTPTSSSTPAIAVVSTNLQLLNASNGELISQMPWSSTNGSRVRILVGNVTGSSEPQFLVWDGSYGIAAFGTEPLRLLWQNNDRQLSTATLLDRVGSVMKDVVILDTNRQLFKLDNAGNVALAGGVIDFYPSLLGSIHLSDVAVDLLAPSGTGDGTKAIAGSNLQIVTASMETYSDWFNKFEVADLDGSGVEKLVGLADRAFNGARDSWLRIVDMDSGHEEWAARFPSNVGVGEADEYLDLAIGSPSISGSRRIYLLGGPYGLGTNQQVTIVDGATRALVSRRPIAIGSNSRAGHIRAFTLGGVEKLAIVSTDTPVGGATRVHVLDAESLALEWSSPTLDINTDIRWTDLAQDGPDSVPMFYVALHGAGIFAVDLEARQVKFSVPALPFAAALQHHPDGRRLAYVDWSGLALRVIDAVSGSPIQSTPLGQEYYEIAADPMNPDRFVLAKDGTLCSFNVNLGRCEGYSPPIGSWYAQAPFYVWDRVISRVVDGESQFLIGNGYGAWLATLGDDTLFADGFEETAAP